MASFLDFCSKCKTTVSVTTIKVGDELRDALSSDEAVKVIHTATLANGTSEDHIWELSIDHKLEEGGR